jgi:hypothetical protein
MPVMSIRALAFLYLVLAQLTACSLAGALAERKRVHAEADEIERAYAAGDAARLEKIEHESEYDSHKARARALSFELRSKALLAMDCPAFETAFTPLVVRGDDGRTQEVGNPATGFGAAADQLEPAQRAAFEHAVVEKAADCKSQLLFRGELGWLLDADDDRHRGQLLIDLEHEGKPIFEIFLALLHAQNRHTLFKSNAAFAWLESTKSAAACPELEAAARSADIGTRAFLVAFYTKKGCRLETVRAAKELIATESPLLRMEACQAEQLVGDTSLLEQMTYLSQNDTTRDIGHQDVGVWRFHYLTYPVREVCQEAINELHMKSISSRR